MVCKGRDPVSEVPRKVGRSVREPSDKGVHRTRSGPRPGAVTCDSLCECCGPGRPSHSACSSYQGRSHQHPQPRGHRHSGLLDGRQVLSTGVPFARTSGTARRSYQSWASWEPCQSPTSQTATEGQHRKWAFLRTVASGLLWGGFLHRAHFYTLCKYWASRLVHLIPASILTEPAGNPMGSRDLQWSADAF